MCFGATLLKPCMFACTFAAVCNKPFSVSPQLLRCLQKRVKYWSVVTFLLTWQRGQRDLTTGWLQSFFFAILRAHLKITEQQAPITAFFWRWSDEKMIPPPNPPLLLYPVQNQISGFPVEWPGDEMCKQEDLCCRTHCSLQRSFPKSIRSVVWLLPKNQDPRRASLITHVQAPCWHEKHFCKSHQITVCKVLHKVSEARQKIFPAFFFSLHEITNEPKTGTTTANYSDSIEEGMSHQFTTFLNGVHMNRQKRWKKMCHVFTLQPQEEKRNRVKQRSTNSEKLCCSTDPRTQLS